MYLCLLVKLHTAQKGVVDCSSCVGARMLKEKKQAILKSSIPSRPSLSMGCLEEGSWPCLSGSSAVLCLAGNCLCPWLCCAERLAWPAQLSNMHNLLPTCPFQPPCVPTPGLCARGVQWPGALPHLLLRGCYWRRWRAAASPMPHVPRALPPRMPVRTLPPCAPLCASTTSVPVSAPPLTCLLG